MRSTAPSMTLFFTILAVSSLDVRLVLACGVLDDKAGRRRDIVQPGGAIFGKGEQKGGLLEAAAFHQLAEGGGADRHAPPRYLRPADPIAGFAESGAFRHSLWRLRFTLG